MAYDLTTWLAFAEKLPPIGYVVASHKEIPVTHKGAADPTALIIALLARSISNLKGVIVLARAESSSSRQERACDAFLKISLLLEGWWPEVTNSFRRCFKMS